MPTDPTMCDFPDWHAEHDFTYDGLTVLHCPGRYAIKPYVPAPSVRRAQIPAEARVAGMQAAWMHLQDDAPLSADEVALVEAVLVAAAPVLLSEYQQRIEAALDEALNRPYDDPCGGECARCSTWPQRFERILRAALGSTKTPRTEPPPLLDDLIR